MLRVLFSTTRVVFQKADVKFLICTDVAARGIDISKLPYGMVKVWLWSRWILPVGQVQYFNYMLSFTPTETIFVH